MRCMWYLILSCVVGLCVCGPVIQRPGESMDDFFKDPLRTYARVACTPPAGTQPGEFVEVSPECRNIIMPGGQVPVEAAPFVHAVRDRLYGTLDQTLYTSASDAPSQHTMDLPYIESMNYLFKGEDGKYVFVSLYMEKLNREEVEALAAISRSRLTDAVRRKNRNNANSRPTITTTTTTRRPTILNPITQRTTTTTKSIFRNTNGRLSENHSSEGSIMDLPEMYEDDVTQTPHDDAFVAQGRLVNTKQADGAEASDYKLRPPGADKSNPTDIFPNHVDDSMFASTRTSTTTALPAPSNHTPAKSPRNDLNNTGPVNSVDVDVREFSQFLADQITSIGGIVHTPNGPYYMYFNMVPETGGDAVDYKCTFLGEIAYRRVNVMCVIDPNGEEALDIINRYERMEAERLKYKRGNTQPGGASNQNLQAMGSAFIKSTVPPIRTFKGMISTRNSQGVAVQGGVPMRNSQGTAMQSGVPSHVG